MSALDPVVVWVDLFDLVDHPPTDGELETFGQAIEQAVRASVAAEIRAERTQVPTGDVAGQFEAAALGLAATIAEGKQP